MSKIKSYISNAKQGDKYIRQVKKTLLKKPDRKLYTEAEAKRRRSLQTKKRSLQKKIDKISAGSYVIADKRTMRSLRKQVGQGDLAYELNSRGYFKDPDYSTRDIREWMLSNGDDALLREVLDTVNPLLDDDLKVADDPTYELQVNGKGTDDLKQLNAELADVEGELSHINVNAQNRKNRQMLKYMDQKYKLKNGDGLLEALSKGEVVYDSLSNPEKAAINYLKNTLATEIVKGLDLEGMDPDKASVIRDAVYTSLMGNPVQGLRSALRGQVALEVTKKYGNAEGDLAAGMMDFMTSTLTGKPNMKSMAGTLFAYTINSSGLNRSLMAEVSEELVNSGKSSNTEENMKMYTRDVLIDVAKDVIMSGGNLAAALPKVIKDLVVDSAQFGVRQVKANKEDAKKEEKEKKAKEAIKKAEEKAGDKPIGELTEEEQNEILSKFLQ